MQAVLSLEFTWAIILLTFGVEFRAWGLGLALACFLSSGCGVKVELHG